MLGSGNPRVKVEDEARSDSMKSASRRSRGKVERIVSMEDIFDYL